MIDISEQRNDTWAQNHGNKDCGDQKAVHLEDPPIRGRIAALLSYRGFIGTGHFDHYTSVLEGPGRPILNSHWTTDNRARRHVIR